MARRIDPAAGAAAVRRWREAQAGSAGERFSGQGVDRKVVATAVRYSLEELAARHPGHSVEVRVPPFGVTQCVAGPRHTRGTPPNVVETEPGVWLALACGLRGWEEAEASGALLASGERADLHDLLPLFTV